MAGDLFGEKRLSKVKAEEKGMAMLSEKKKDRRRSKRQYRELNLKVGHKSISWGGQRDTRKVQF